MFRGVGYTFETTYLRDFAVGYTEQHYSKTKLHLASREMQAEEYNRIGKSLFH